MKCEKRWKASLLVKVNKVRMKMEERNARQNKPRVEIEKRNAWQNKPHKTSKSMAEGEQGKDEDRQKKCMAK
jgi:hypothetical protein